MIRIYSAREIEKIAASGRILSDVFKQLFREIKIGAGLKQLDDLAYRLIKKAGAEPAFLGYQPNGAKHPFPYSICASLNNVIVHGKPSDYKLKNGDVLKIDCGVKYKAPKESGKSDPTGQGFYSDAAVTVIVGKSSKEAENLVKATKKALEEAIKCAKPGNYLGDIGWIIENTAKKFGVKVIKGLTGHGIGKGLHEEPTIYNFGEKGRGIKLKPGMVLALEPMFSAGADNPEGSASWRTYGAGIIQLKDESWATADGSLSAHFEHTVAITALGSRVLTNFL